MKKLEGVMVDPEYSHLLDRAWVSNGYVKVYLGKIDGKYVTKLLHRYIMGEPDGLVVDHINHNTLDNRVSNLRICTNQQNLQNGGGQEVGVSYRKDRNKWRAYIMVDRKQISLGLHDTKEQALLARRKGELKYFGKYAPKGVIV